MPDPLARRRGWRRCCPRSPTLWVPRTRSRHGARLAEKSEDRRDAARQYIEAVGGRLHGFWYAFGEYDAYNLWEAPDNVSMAAVAMAISGGGALSKYETTVLLTVEETMDAMARARDIRYRPPGT